jgi:hypothetical protein
MTRAKAITNNIVQNINTQKILFRLLLTCLIILFTVYIYIIGSITFNVIARKSLESTVASLTSNVNQMDLSYLNSVNKINKEYALSLGFVDVHQNIFASRNINHVAMR